MRTALSPLSLLRPRTLRDALAMLRDEGPLTPVAGCTDLYVGLQFGTLADKRFVDLWPLRELQGIADDRGTLRIGALTTYTDLIQSPLVRRRVPDACRRIARSRRPPDSEPRDAWRQHRQRFARRRRVAGAFGGRCNGRPEQHEWRATGAVQQLLHWLSSQRAASRRDHRGNRGPSNRRTTGTGERWALDGPRRSPRSCARLSVARRFVWLLGVSGPRLSGSAEPSGC